MSEPNSNATHERAAAGASRPIRAAVLTVSDRCSRGEATDTSGPAVCAMLRERLEHEVRQADRARCSMAVLLIDLDHFKEINDTLGHLFGDDLLQVLRFAAQRLDLVGCG